MIQTTDPDGNPLKFTHRRKNAKYLYRIVEEAVYDFATGARHYLLANEHGVLFVTSPTEFDIYFEYIPGGQ